jgi:hypothetical protein
VAAASLLPCSVFSYGATVVSYDRKLYIAQAQVVVNGCDSHKVSLSMTLAHCSIETETKNLEKTHKILAKKFQV